MENTVRVLPLKATARAIGLKSTDLKADADAGLVPFTKVGSEYVFELRALEASIAARAQQDTGKVVRCAR